jgi:hypothetical protein
VAPLLALRQPADSAKHRFSAWVFYFCPAWAGQHGLKENQLLKKIPETSLGKFSLAAAGPGMEDQT